MVDLEGDPYALLFLVFWILWTFWFVACIVMFFSKKIRNSFYIKSRSPLLILFSAFGQYAMMTSLTFKIIITPRKYPNMVDHWFIWFMLPLHFVPYPIRALRFIILYHVTMPENQADSAPPAEGEKRSRNVWKWFNTHQMFMSDRAFIIYNWIIMAIAFIIGLVRNIAEEVNHPDVVGVQQTTKYWISCTVLLIAASFFLWLSVYYLSKIHDELKYNIELSVIGVLWIVFIGLYIVIGWSKAEPENMQSIVLIILCVASFLVSFGMPLHLANVKPPEGDLGVDVLDDLDKLMKDREGAKLFYVFMQKRMCTEGFFFYRAIEKFRELLPDQHDELRTQFANIKRRFIGNGAQTPINISDQRVKDIEKYDPNGIIPPNVFADAFQANLQVLKTDVFPAFKASVPAKTYAKRLKREAALQ